MKTPYPTVAERRDCALSRPVPSPQANGLHYEGRAGQGRAGCPNAKVKPGLGVKQLEQRLE